MRSKSKVSSESSRRAREPSTGSTWMSRRGDLRLPRPERGRQVDDGARCSSPCCRRAAGRATVGGLRRGGRATRSASRHRRRAPGSGLDPLLTGRRQFALHAGLYGFPKAEATRAGDELLERLGLAGAGRPADRRRSPAACGGGSTSRWPGPPAEHHLPRRADHRASTRRAGRPLGEVRAPGARRGRDDLPDHAVPRGGRRLATGSGSSTTARSSPRAPPTELKAQVGGADLEVVPALASDELGRRGARPVRRARPAAGRETPSPSGSASPAKAARRRVVRALDQPGIAIADLELRLPTLDDVFLEDRPEARAGEGEEPEPPPRPGRRDGSDEELRRRSPAGAGSRSSRPRC